MQSVDLFSSPSSPSNVRRTIPVNLSTYLVHLSRPGNKLITATLQVWCGGGRGRPAPPPTVVWRMGRIFISGRHTAQWSPLGHQHQPTTPGQQPHVVPQTHCSWYLLHFDVKIISIATYLGHHLSLTHILLCPGQQHLSLAVKETLWLCFDPAIRANYVENSFTGARWLSRYLTAASQCCH